MRPRNLLILAIVVLALGAFIGFFEWDRPSPEAREDESRRLFPVEMEAVTAVAVVPRAGERLRLERQGSMEHWRLTEPLAATADSAAVQELVSALVALRWQRKEGEFDAAALGLEPPRLEVTLEVGEEQQELSFGSGLPAADQVVARRGAFVYVVEDALLALLEQPVDDWRARALLPGSRYQVEAVRIAHTGEALEFLRQGVRERFEVSGGGLAEPDRADGSRMGELLGELESLRVAAFQDGADPSALGLDPATATLEVHLKGQEEPFRLELGVALPETGEVYGRSGDQLFTLRTTLPALLALPAQAWRSLDLTAFDPFEVQGVSVRDGEGVVELTHEDGAWQRDGVEIGGSAAADLIDALTEARANRLLDLPDSLSDSLPDPLLTLELRGGSGGADERQELIFHPAPEGTEGVAVRSSGRGAVLLWQASAFTTLRDRIAALRSAAAAGDTAE